VGNTTRKVKAIGTETYINAATGEVHEMDVVEIEERDANFCKLWVSSILTAIDELSSQRMKIVFWLVNEANKKRNVIAMTTRELSENIGVSRTTLIDTLQILEQHDVVRRKTGIVFMNPEFVYKGGRGGRMEVLTRYRELPKGHKEPEKPEEKAERLVKQMEALMRQMKKIENELAELEFKGAAE
jgi:predicted transcriptional regulator|tara:strand:- start:522 stop:1076 length:555 start_codon:yes stop_codon:yes gene_type:complete